MALVKASHKFARISPTKVRHFTRLIQGMPAEKAAEQLRFMPNRGAKMLLKVLRSAMANAEDLGARNTSSIPVKQAYVDMGPRFKRVWPRGRGRADMLTKKFSHIHVVLETSEVN